MRSELMTVLQSRGYIHQCTDAERLDALAAAEAVTGYIGFDLTAPSLHVGNLVSVMLLRRLQQTGHRPIVLLGGGTTMIGDPSGKDEARQLLTPGVIAANKASIARVFSRFIDLDRAIVVDNADWLAGLQYIPFLREVGAHFSVNRMLSFDSVRLRLEREQPLSFLEFNYMILQAYDFLELGRRHGCRLQMGGSDQWGNIVNGVELSRRIDARELFGLTTPLITTADGAKMGKTAAGAMWLAAEMLSPYDYWQFWRNTHDADVGRFLRLFTDVPLDEIARLEALAGAEVNAAKKALADAATALAHGPDAAAEAADTARRTFEEGAGGTALPTLAVTDAIGVIDALIGLGLAASRNEARRLIAQGGVRAGSDLVSDPSATLAVGAEPVRLSAGRKRHGQLVRASG
ncbi:MAG: tyrosine--tRNA ligase [Sphingomonadaceae bacterium]|nr:tyrosine--tRNA ligase [Sphingomonadaceae bacterium]